MNCLLNISYTLYNAREQTRSAIVNVEQKDFHRAAQLLNEAAALCEKAAKEAKLVADVLRSSSKCL